MRASLKDIGYTDGMDAFRSGRRLEQPELGQRGDAVIETDLLDDLAVDDLEHRGAREVHLAQPEGRRSGNR